MGALLMRRKFVRLDNPTPSCCIPDGLVQECSERTGIFPEAVLVLMVDDIDAFAVFQNKVQFITCGIGWS
jgi:hypothetical protein